MRDIDGDIRSSLERLTDPHGSTTPGADALWSDLVGRRRKRRNRNRALAALPLLLVVVLAAGIFSTRGSDDARSDVAAGEGGERSRAEPEGSWSVPDVGASPQQLSDGTPVWLVRHDDGSVSVLNAVSTHRPFGAGTLVGWCESSRGFIDPMFGSMYDEHGRRQGGPSPRGLDKYPVVTDGDRVTVTGQATRQLRPEEGGTEAAEPVGSHCFHDDGDYNPGVIEGWFTTHPIASAAPATTEHAMRQPPGTLVVLDAPIVIVDGKTPIVCTSPMEGSPPSCEGIPAPGLSPQDQRSVVLGGRFIAWQDDGGLADIAYVGERTVIYGDGAERSEGDAALDSRERDAGNGSLSFEPFTMRYRTTQESGTELEWTLDYTSVDEWSMELVSTTSSAGGDEVGATETFKDGTHTISRGPNDSGYVEEVDGPLAPLQVLHRGPMRNFDTLYGQPAEPAVHEGRNGYETTETIDCPHRDAGEADWCGNPGGQVTLTTFYEFNSDGVPVLVHSYVEGTNPLVWRFEALNYERKD